ncbi:site-2 protease family protein [Cohnella sp. CFH 77786]|uniref:site-2 protease family protein n=1 Tax=Cohnella sp. CFH 77786 TaxID=2662265 RepID=UPI001C60A319|nr:site-2 protease family protein [Cohnella sp. CFH 77786]MBW5446939.1 site-2 protease family protein [Cohnella sp. CFH 77786]
MAEPEQHSAAKKKRGSGSWAAATGLLLLLGKIKPFLLFLFKAGKPLWTMALSIGAYALIFPWTFAVGFVLLLLVHELGHVWAARRAGLPVSAPMFIPFLGALILLKRNPKDAATEAYIGIGGPMLGSAGAFVCYAIGLWSGQPVWHALAYSGFFLNLINLLPIHPLDGGRIVTAVSRWLWLVGVAAGPIIIWHYGNFLFFFIWLLFLWEMYKKFIRDRRKSRNYAVEGEYRTEADPLLPSWFAAGEAHTRELPFTAYCRLDGEHAVEFHWEAMSFKGELTLPQPCMIDRVVLRKVRGPDEAGKLTFAVRAEGRLFESEHYYEVPAGVRVRMGLMYGGLIGVLSYMIWQIEKAGLIPPA